MLFPCIIQQHKNTNKGHTKGLILQEGNEDIPAQSAKITQPNISEIFTLKNQFSILGEGDLNNVSTLTAQATRARREHHGDALYKEQVIHDEGNITMGGAKALSSGDGGCQGMS